ncbi:MAG: tetratricopeptide repeat protein [Candidatus Omnitrophica bacterium]|nr:tetratricopeptide repeat protein [Candidatus Omnitrophota bacterium]
MRRLALLGLIICSASRLASAEEATKEPADWPTVIAKLQQQMYDRPGMAYVRQQLATAYNNYGVSLGEQRQWRSATEQLERARELDPLNQQVVENLSTMYANQAQEQYVAHQLVDAETLIRKALAANPQLAIGYALLGRIEYDRQRLKEAKAAWQQAIQLDPQLPGIAQQLAQVTEELPIESKFERLSQASFDLRYEEKLQSPVGFDIRDALLDARRRIGLDFACWPKHKIIVLIYSAESFRQLRRDTPEWVGGQFDGKIRVPLPSAQLPSTTVRQIVFHEYTHAVIAELTGVRCPRWLNEGLAEYEGRQEGVKSLHALSRAHSAQQLIPLTELSERFSTTQSEDAALVYDQSYSLAAYLLDRYGWWRIRRLLKALGEGQSLDAALTDVCHVTLAKLEGHWRAWLPDFLKTAPTGPAP